MSWLFGGGDKKPSSIGEKALMDLSKDDNEKKSEKSGGSVYKGSGFDPTGLERAAKAAKILDVSKNSKKAFDVAMSQEATKQLEYKTASKQYDMQIKQVELERVRREAEEARESLKVQTEEEMKRLKQRDKLERQRQMDMLQYQRKLQEEERLKTEESIKRQEELRRKTLEYENELRQRAEVARAQAEADGRIKQERLNIDIKKELKEQEAQLFRSTVLQGIREGGLVVGEGVTSFLGDGKMIAGTVIVSGGIFLAYYFSKQSFSVGADFIRARMLTPPLVRETSKQSLLRFVQPRHYAGIASNQLGWLYRQLLATNKGKGGASGEGGSGGSEALKGIVLEPSLHRKLERIATTTKNARKHRAPFRHLLLHGPPGTGKTMFAKQLAKHTGLHYAILTGGDIAPLGRQAVVELHKLFDWASAGGGGGIGGGGGGKGKGVLLFVDEADAFLRRRSTEVISEDMRNALNAFLYRTGTESDTFMVVYASNRPEQFDEAINDRIDDMIQFNLPDHKQRLLLLNKYMLQYLPLEQGGGEAEGGGGGAGGGASKSGAAAGGGVGGVGGVVLYYLSLGMLGDRFAMGGGPSGIRVEGLSMSVINDVANLTDGFSGREIAKLCIAYQAAAYGTADKTLRPALMEEVTRDMIQQKQIKQRWLLAAESEMKMFEEKDHMSHQHHQLHHHTNNSSNSSNNNNNSTRDQTAPAPAPAPAPADKSPSKSP